MRMLSTLIGRRSKRMEGTPFQLDADRRKNGKFSDWLRVPKGVTLTEEEISGVQIVRLSSGNRSRGTVLYIHGGAYVMGSPRQALTCAHLCVDDGPDVVGVKYRLAPENPAPAAVGDVLSVYSALLDEIGPGNLVLIGESAGGGLLLRMLQRARDAGKPMPSLAIATFPWVDLTVSGASTLSNIGKDMLVRSHLVEAAQLYAGNLNLNDPDVSPLYGSFEGLPRTVIHVGTHDLLLDDARALSNAMQRDGADVALEEWPGAVHGFTALPFPEGRRYREWLKRAVNDVLAQDHRASAHTH